MNKFKNIIIKHKVIIGKIIFSLIFVGIALLKLFNKWFDSKADITFLGIIIIALLPWLSGYLKSIEAFGVKAEFLPNSKKEELDKEADKIIKSKENITNDNESTKTKNELEVNIGTDDIINSTNDPLEKLVLIRYEIEKSLREIYISKYGNEKYLNNIRKLSDELCRKEIIDKSVRNLIFDLLPVLNKAVHSEISIKEYDNVLWIVDKGILIIDYLNTIKNM